jgi:hypothetical protein
MQVSPRLLFPEQACDALHEARDGLADRKATRIELQRARSIAGDSGAASDFELGASVALGRMAPHALLPLRSHVALGQARTRASGSPASISSVTLSR